MSGRFLSPGGVLGEVWRGFWGGGPRAHGRQLGAILAPRGLQINFCENLGPTWKPSWSQVGTKLEPSWSQEASREAPGVIFWLVETVSKHKELLDTILGRFVVHFRVPGGCKNVVFVRAGRRIFAF